MAHRDDLCRGAPPTANHHLDHPLTARQGRLALPSCHAKGRSLNAGSAEPIPRQMPLARLSRWSKKLEGGALRRRANGTPPARISSTCRFLRARGARPSKSFYSRGIISLITHLARELVDPSIVAKTQIFRSSEAHSLGARSTSRVRNDILTNYTERYSGIPRNSARAWPSLIKSSKFP